MALLVYKMLVRVPKQIVKHLESNMHRQEGPWAFPPFNTFHVGLF